jgi:hypothetical protein
MPDRGKRHLVIQVERLGDLVQTTPLLMDLRKTDPNSTIDVLCWTEFAPIVQGMPGVFVRTLPGRRVTELNDEIDAARSTGRPPVEAPATMAELDLPAYDRVINVSHGLFAPWLSSRLKANRRDGGTLNDAGEWLYSGDWLTLLVALAAICRDTHFNLVDLYRACAVSGMPAGDAHGYVTCAASLPVQLPEGPLAVIAPAANEQRRQFEASSTIQVFSGLETMGFKIVLVSGPAEQSFVGSLARASPVPVVDLSGKTTAPELAEILRRAAIILSADSGPAHIGAALARPLVGLYGASLAPVMTAPWGAGHLVLVANHMNAFSPDLIMAAIRNRLGLASDTELRREAVAAEVEAWRTAMLPTGADALGGVTTMPLHADRVDGRDILRRLVRHVMVSIIMEKTAGDMAHLSALAPPIPPFDVASDNPLADWENRLGTLAAEVGGALNQLRKRRFEGLADLANRITMTIDELKQSATNDPVISHVALFLDWKLRMMPAYEPERVFRENERELKRAARALGMARQTAEMIWPVKSA